MAADNGRGRRQGGVRTAAGGAGASALVVGSVTCAAEAVSLLLRVVVGPWADRLGNHWSWTIAGYAVTAVCISMLAVAPLAGAAGLGIASTLIIVERVGKPVRSPSKTALLAHAAGPVGRGRTRSRIRVHKTLDLVGAVTGPLLVAVVLSATGALSAALLVLAVPGAATLALLWWLRHRVPDSSIYNPASDPASNDPAGPPGAGPADGGREDRGGLVGHRPRRGAPDQVLRLRSIGGTDRCGPGLVRDHLVPSDQLGTGAAGHGPGQLRHGDGFRCGGGAGQRLAVRPDRPEIGRAHV